MAGLLLDRLHQRLAQLVDALAQRLGSEHSAAALLALSVEEPNALLALRMRLQSDTPPEPAVQAWLASLFADLTGAALYAGRATQALTVLTDIAARSARRVPASALTAATQFHLGQLRQRTDDLSGAAASYAAALPLYRQIEARLGEANTLKALGDLQLRTSDLSGAASSYAAALPLYRQIEARLGEANTLQTLGQLSLVQGAPVAAFAQTLQALQLHQTLYNQNGVGAAHGYLARVSASVGALPQMVGLSGRAVRIFIDIDDRFGQMLTLDTLGRALLPQATAQGLVCLLLAQAIAGAIGDPRAEAIGQLLASLRAEGVDDAALAEAIAELRTQAQAMVEAMFADAEAAVERGELDLYALPDDIVSADEGDAEGADER